jgi:hypothetical protein
VSLPPRPSVVMLPCAVDALEAGDDDHLAGGQVGAHALSSMRLMRALVKAESVWIGTCQPA